MDHGTVSFLVRVLLWFLSWIRVIWLPGMRSLTSFPALFAQEENDDYDDDGIILG